MFRLLRRVRYAGVASTLCLFLLLGGGGWAATNFVDGGNDVAACVGKAGGLTLLRAGKTCHKHQTEVSWNVQGPKGDKGDPGAPGPQGATGATGSPGAQGPGAIDLATTLPQAPTTTKTLATVSGLTVTAVCFGFGGSLQIATTTGTTTLQDWGVMHHGGTADPLTDDNNVGMRDTTQGSTADIQGYARNSAGGHTLRIDATIEGLGTGGGNNCDVWGLVIPST